MIPADSDAIRRIVRVFEDTIADSGKLREGLTDDEAIPLVEWGVAYANTYAQTMTRSGAPLPPDEQISDQAYNLTRLMTRLNWVVTYLDKKDAAWLTNTLLLANKLSQDLLGPNAPMMSEDSIPGWLTAQRGRPIGEMLRDLMARFSPPDPSAAASATGAAFSPPQAPPGPATGVASVDAAPKPAGLGHLPPASPTAMGSAGLPGQACPLAGEKLLQDAPPPVFGGRRLPRRSPRPDEPADALDNKVDPPDKP